MEADEAFVKDFNFSRCFLIMDNMIDNEMAKPEEIPLFFYPPSRGDEGLSKQLSAISVCMAMSSICLHFTHVPVWAFAIALLTLLGFSGRAEGGQNSLQENWPVYLGTGPSLLFLNGQVLTGLVTDSNKALLHQINLLWDCFQFYNGSFGRIEKLSGPNRASLQKNVAQYVWLCSSSDDQTERRHFWSLSSRSSTRLQWNSVRCHILRLLLPLRIQAPILSWRGN